MVISDLPFGTTDWAKVPETRHKGKTGDAIWRTRQFGDVRLRMVEYSPGYKADHWCRKGHFLLVLEGELVTELADGRVSKMTPVPPPRRARSCSSSISTLSNIVMLSGPLGPRSTSTRGDVHEPAKRWRFASLPRDASLPPPVGRRSA